MPESNLSHNPLSRALRQLDLLEDYCDMFDRLVDMSDIGRFGDENAGVVAVGLPDAELGASRAYLYPSATSVAYINETEFRWIRARSRAFLAVNPYAAGAVRNRVAYAVGSGHTYNVAARQNTPIDRTDRSDQSDQRATRLADCRAVLAEFCRVNRWMQRQRETVRRLDRDGERFLRFFPDVERGVLRVRFVEPLEIQNPPGATAAEGWFFGIRFARHGGGLDMETPLEYAIVDVNPQGTATGLRETVPAGDMQRLTANVDLSSPRGLPVFYALQGHLGDAVRTLKATGRIVEFRARIGMIRRHVNATRETVQQAAETLRGDAPEQPRAVRTARMYPYAAIIDTSDATDYQFPSEAAPVDKNVAAIQAELRAAAAALGMPEYMLSGDASNANYSSTM
jgi:capsid protein